MNPAGWALLIFAWSAIIISLAMCYIKIFSAGTADDEGDEENDRSR